MTLYCLTGNWFGLSSCVRMSFETFPVTEIQYVLSDVINSKDGEVVGIPLLLCITGEGREDVAVPGNCLFTLALCLVTSFIEFDELIQGEGLYFLLVHI